MGKTKSNYKPNYSAYIERLDSLRRLAAGLGYVLRRGPQSGSTGSPTAMLNAIAAGETAVFRPVGSAEEMMHIAVRLDDLAAGSGIDIRETLLHVAEAVRVAAAQKESGDWA